MYEILREGRAVLKIKKANNVSKAMEVFYNPVMKLNRDISILLLNSIDKNKLSIADPLAGTGVRSIRFILELNKSKTKTITINDYSKNAVKSIKDNLSLNKINNKKIKIFNEDANLFLLNSSGFDYIDIDPFGSSNSYLEAAIKRISRNGILAATNTDTAALTGTYPKTCVRKYWSVPKRDYMMHETGIRILIRKIQLIGMQYEKALFPIFSYFKDHYFRVFFHCIKGKKLCDEIAAKHGMFNDAGPLWMGKLWDSRLVSKMHSTLLKTPIDNDLLIINFQKNKKNSIKDNNKNIFKNKKIINNNQNNNELLKFLKIIKEESKIDIVGFYDMHNIARKLKLKTMMKKEDIIKKIRKKGFKASNTHFSGTGIRANIDYKKFLKLI